MHEHDASRDPLRVVRTPAAPGSRPRPAASAESAERRPSRVAAVIPAKNEAAHVAGTVRGARSIPNVDLVVVVDDGSTDDTQHVARAAGAVVVRHSQNRGKASAMETGASVVSMRDAEGEPPRLLLFLDADLGESSVNAATLVPPVLAGEADLSIGVMPGKIGNLSHVARMARRAIRAVSGWVPKAPLSGQRCLNREAYEAALPLAHGYGVETGMTIDLLRAGFAVVEVPCDLRAHTAGPGLRGQLVRAAQLRDISYAIAVRKLGGHRGRS